MPDESERRHMGTHQTDLTYCHCSLEMISDNECSRTENSSFGPNITENI